MTRFLSLPRAVGWDPTFFKSEILKKIQPNSNTVKSIVIRVKYMPSQVVFSVELIVCDVIIEKKTEPAIIAKIKKKPKENAILSQGDIL
jgi:hypothetical protein